MCRNLISLLELSWRKMRRSFFNLRHMIWSLDHHRIRFITGLDDEDYFWLGFLGGRWWSENLCNLWLWSSDKKEDRANFQMRMHAHWFCPHQSFSSVRNFREMLENFKLSKVANSWHKIYIQLNFMEETHAWRGIIMIDIWSMNTTSFLHDLWSLIPNSWWCLYHIDWKKRVKSGWRRFNFNQKR